MHLFTFFISHKADVLQSGGLALKWCPAVLHCCCWLWPQQAGGDWCKLDFYAIWRLAKITAQQLTTAQRHWPQQQPQQQGPDEALQPMADAGRGLAPQQQQQVAMDQDRQLARGGSGGLAPEQQQQQRRAGGESRDAALEWYKLEQVSQWHL